jgi:hypothetical protein
MSFGAYEVLAVVRTGPYEEKALLLNIRTLRKTVRYAYAGTYREGETVNSYNERDEDYE